MTTAPAPKEINGFRRVAMGLAHTQPAVLVAGIITQTVAAVAHSPAWTAVSVIVTIAVGVTIGAEYFHSSRLCPRCAAHLPLDGHTAADKHATWLRAHHWATTPVALLAWLGLLWLDITGPDGIAHYPLYLLWIFTSAAYLKHRPLELWCPQCNDWDDGDGGDDKTPDPTPDPSPREHTDEPRERTAGHRTPDRQRTHLSTIYTC
ncbi:MAG: hypothetical protein ACRDRX_24725 [Pseudonocardiaceae bacterium]